MKFCFVTRILQLLEELSTKAVAKTEPRNLDPQILHFQLFVQKPNLKQEPLQSIYLIRRGRSTSWLDRSNRMFVASDGQAALIPAATEIGIELTLEKLQWHHRSSVTSGLDSVQLYQSDAHQKQRYPTESNSATKLKPKTKLKDTGSFFL